jgi:hypothetical protein
LKKHSSWQTSSARRSGRRRPHLDTSWDKRPIGEDIPNVDDPTLVALVPDKKRRTFLLGLTTQLRALGDTLDDLITARERKDPP